MLSNNFKIALGQYLGIKLPFLFKKAEVFRLSKSVSTDKIP